MNTPKIDFLGWEDPAIELVAEKLFNALTDKKTAPLYRRAIVVVPTAGSGQRLRERLAEKAFNNEKKKPFPILLPKIILAGQLISVKGKEIATEMETLSAWVHLLTAEGADPVAQYAPLIPRRPETHRERWAVGVAHKLMAIRTRLMQENVNLEQIRSLHAQHESGYISASAQLPEDAVSARQTLQARSKVAANEQARWRKLQSLFDKVDALLSPKISQQKAQEDFVNKAAWPGQSRLLIIACVPEFSPQLKTYLSKLHGKDGGKVEIWVHAPISEAYHFDDFGLPLETAWANQKIEIPGAINYSNEDKCIVDNETSTIHQVDDAEAMAAEALRLAGGHDFRNVVLAVGDSEFSPAIVNAFATASPAWNLNLPEGRNAMTTDLGKLPGQLADACDARKHRPLWSDTQGKVNNNGTQGLDAFVALLTNTALQTALAENKESLIGMQEHVERLRMLLLPGSEGALLSMLKNFPAVDEGYKAIDKLRKQHNEAFFKYAEKVTECIDGLCCAEIGKTLLNLAGKLETCIKGSEQKQLAAGIARQMRECAGISTNLPSSLCCMELLRRRVEDKVAGPAFADLPSTAGDLLGWRELAYTSGKQVILAAMHDGVIPEPVPEDDFLPESLCNELGIRHEKFRIARDSYLLTAIIASRQKDGGRVDFILARQKEDGSVLAPSPLLLRCRDEELPKRALTLFAESKTPKVLPKTAACPLRRAESCEDSISPGMLESIDLIAPGKQNPFTKWSKNKEGKMVQKSYSPSSLSLFLQCPLSFWIKNLFNIDLGDTYKENKGELESNEYGSVMHAVLDKLVRQFHSWEELLTACPEAENDTQAAEEHMLTAARNIAADEWQRVYNSTSTRQGQTLPMEVQLQAIERTLAEFVRQHLNDLNCGWCNVAREYTLEPTMCLANGDTVSFSMNADRIDYNPSTRRWRIIDYKTSSTEKNPHDIHFDPLDGNDASLYCQFMNVQGYKFGTVPFGEKLYRWDNVQLPLYAYGLRQMSAHELNQDMPDTPLTDVIPDLLYYNLQSKTEKLVVFPLVLDERVIPLSPKAPCELNTEELFDSAMQTVQSAISMIRDGKCLFSAEALELTRRPYSVLNTSSWDKRAPRFGALTLESDPRSLFCLPKLNK